MNTLQNANVFKSYDIDTTLASFLVKDTSLTPEACNFRAFAENNPYSFIVVSKEMSIVYANHQACRLLNYDQQDFFRTEAGMIFPNDMLDRLHEIFEAQPGKDPYPSLWMNTSIINKEGVKRPIKLCVSGTVWDGIPSAVAILPPDLETEAVEGTRKVLLEEALKQQLREKDQQIEEQRQMYDAISMQLLETNKAIAVLARSYEKSKEELGIKISKVINRKIIPVLIELKASTLATENGLNLDILEKHLRDLGSGLLNNQERFDLFSSTELKVATMIKNGATTQEIANQLYISPHTVKTHRKNIRKKLNIQNQAANLMVYLNSRM